MAVLGTWIKTCDVLPSVKLYNRSSISCVSGSVVLRFVKADIHGILRKVVCFRGSDGQLGEDQIRSAGQKMRKYRVRRSCDTHTDTYFTYFTLLPFLFRMLYWNLVCLEPIPKLLKNSWHMELLDTDLYIFLPSCLLSALSAPGWVCLFMFVPGVPVVRPLRRKHFPNPLRPKLLMDLRASRAGAKEPVGLWRLRLLHPLKIRMWWKKLWETLIKKEDNPMSLLNVHATQWVYVVFLFPSMYSDYAFVCIYASSIF